MLVPLYILAAGALFAGILFYGAFLGHEANGHHEGWYNAFWREALFAGSDNHILDEFHHVPLLVKWSPFIMMALGFLAAYGMYIRSPDLPKQLARSQPALYAFLLNKWYFDEIYDFLFVRPAMRLGRFLWKRGDGWLIDGFGPDGVSARVVDVTNRVVKLQSGYLYHYAFAMLIGIAALITWVMFAGV
jgi:NADH-quinone oxidoreductase subunit L